MRIRKKKWVKPYLESDQVYLINSFKNNNQKTYLEIGMGMGDFITQSASMNEDILYIGLEKDETCVARAIIKAKDLDIDNFKVMLKDASNIEEYIESKSIDRIYLHFSDPWPKKHHHKRRLTYPTFLKKYESLLKDNGELIFKTDNHDFFIDSLDYFKESNFKEVEINMDYHSELLNEPMTMYQKKFSDMGQPIYYAKYVL